MRNNISEVLQNYDPRTQDLSPDLRVTKSIHHNCTTVEYVLEMLARFFAYLKNPSRFSIRQASVTILNDIRQFSPESAKTAVLSGMLQKIVQIDVALRQRSNFNENTYALATTNLADAAEFLSSTALAHIRNSSFDEIKSAISENMIEEIAQIIAELQQETNSLDTYNPTLQNLQTIILHLEENLGLVTTQLKTRLEKKIASFPIKRAELERELEEERKNQTQAEAIINQVQGQIRPIVNEVSSDSSISLDVLESKIPELIQAYKTSIICDEEAIVTLQIQIQGGVLEKLTNDVSEREDIKQNFQSQIESKRRQISHSLEMIGQLEAFSKVKKSLDYGKRYLNRTIESIQVIEREIETLNAESKKARDRLAQVLQFEQTL